MLSRFRYPLLVSTTLFCVAFPAPYGGAENPVKCYTDKTEEVAKCRVISRYKDDGRKSSSSGNPGSGACQDKVTGDSIPCSRDGAWWSQGRQCYVSVQDPQPDHSDPVWGGRKEGVILKCSKLHLGSMRSYPFWMPSAKPAPDPVVLAREAIAQMNLSAIRIGTLPVSNTVSPKAMGLVGRPVWMWADDPDEHTWGPITRSASAGGHTVTATAKVDRVVWNMGDGKTVTCRLPGNKPRDFHVGNDDASPACGYRYEKQGERTVTATSHWVVAWSGAGQRGTITLELASSTTITIGELQVVNVNPTSKPKR